VWDVPVPFQHLNLSYERDFGAHAANQEIDDATQQNICAANQVTAEHSTTSVQPIRSEKIKQWRRDCPRSNALVFRAAPASIVEFPLKDCLALSASSMPPLGFQRVTHRMNIPHEHASYMNFELYDEQNRRQGHVHRPRAGNPVLTMLMCSDGNYNHANPSRNGRGRGQSVSSAKQPVPTPLILFGSSPPCTSFSTIYFPRTTLVKFRTSRNSYEFETRVSSPTLMWYILWRSTQTCDGYLSARRLAKRVHSTVQSIGVDHLKALCALLFASPNTF
jgi:hypothetical protein